MTNSKFQINPKFQIPNNEKGSALIITLLVMAFVTTLVFEVGRLTINEIRQTDSLSDSSVAFHAAEAGIEDGLLRWKFNKNVELPQADMTESNNLALRVDLVTNQVVASADSSRPPANSRNSTYDLKIWYKANQIGDPAALGTPNDNNPKLVRDESKEFDVSNLTGKNIEIRWLKDAKSPSNPLNAYNVNLEWSLFQQDPVSQQITTIAGGLLDASQDSLTVSVPAGGTNYKIRIKMFIGSGVVNGFITSPGPDDAFSRYTIREPSGGKIDTGTTYIESTGYYGRAKRKLRITVDRATNTILGLYGFVLGSPGSSLGQ